MDHPDSNDCSNAEVPLFTKYFTSWLLWISVHRCNLDVIWDLRIRLVRLALHRLLRKRRRIFSALPKSCPPWNRLNEIDWNRLPTFQCQTNGQNHSNLKLFEISILLQLFCIIGRAAAKGGTQPFLCLWLWKWLTSPRPPPSFQHMFIHFHQKTWRYCKILEKSWKFARNIEGSWSILKSCPTISNNFDPFWSLSQVSEMSTRYSAYLFPKAVWPLAQHWEQWFHLRQDIFILTVWPTVRPIYKARDMELFLLWWSLAYMMLRCYAVSIVVKNTIGPILRQRMQEWCMAFWTDRSDYLLRKLKDQITPHVKPSDCYETKVMTWDGGSRWWLDGKEVGG